MVPVSLEVVDTEAPPPALALWDLTKTFRTSWGRRVEALRGVRFEVPRGEVFGLLGPNGAGKSTTLKIVLGHLRPDRGGGTLLGSGLGSVEARSRLGFLPENPYFYDYLSAQEFLDTCASLSGLPRRGRRERIAAVLERVGLDPGLKIRLRKFSKGMLQRAGLAQAILHDPELLILDEPMSGLDPTGRRQIRDLILDLKGEGKTILFSSHVLPDVEALCDRVAILDRGELRRTGRLADLLAHVESGFEIETARLPDSLRDSWARQDLLRESGDRLVVWAEGQVELEERVRQILNGGGSLLGVKPVRGSLEDVFLAEVGGGAPSSARRGAHRSREAA